MSQSLDAYDRRILFELDCNSRRPLSEVSRRVRLGRDLVISRLQRMQTTGILRGCSALINPYKLGYTIYKTYLKLESNRDRWSQLVEFLNKHPNTFWLAECYGSWDLIWVIAARSPKEAYDIQNQLFSDFSDVVTTYDVYTFVNNWWFPKKYLLGSKTNEGPGWHFTLPEVAIGTAPDQYSLDLIEAGIISLVSRNSRLSVTELAQHLNTTPAIVSYRLDKLEKLGVIAGYRIDIDRSRLDMTLFNVQVQPRSYDAAQEQEFHSYCKDHPQVLEYIQQLGGCKLELVIEASGYAEFSAVIDELRERFSGYIRCINYLMIKRDLFHRTPRCLYEPLLDSSLQAAA
ncbi:MAG: Lrp/AsnC family transcriptional regulator [Pseudomonadota bacterium]|jgi:DNA-binding Lrp family transcriptional regulator